ncbi:MAG: DUF998 domain-containing protein [Chloroflexi bacterium]|nr:DUF998 domain-containing protein [Chloroflexota bacterium]
MAVAHGPRIDTPGRQFERINWGHLLTTKKLLLVCGIVASLLYVAATILGAMRWEGYSSTAQSVSELFAIDAPSKSLVDPLFVTYSLLWSAFGVGVWRSAGRKRASGTTPR